MRSARFTMSLANETEPGTVGHIGCLSLRLARRFKESFEEEARQEVGRNPTGSSEGSSGDWF